MQEGHKSRLASEPLLAVENLRVRFRTRRGEVPVLHGVSFALWEGEILGLVGESGSGKSVTLLAIMGLLPRTARVVAGRIRYQGRDLLTMTSRERRALRGTEIAMVFQDPMTSLNPVFPVGEQIRESLRIHRRLATGSGIARWFPWLDRALLARERARVLTLMKEVGIASPELRYLDFPHQFSGGMQQRALIAIALACQPRIVLADEPTTALDVTLQAQILELMRSINQRHGTSIILVTHDLALAAEYCNRIAVMYAGRIVESGRTDLVLARPQHPYTEGLLRCIPRVQSPRRPLVPIAGEVPDLARLPEHACPFAPRCPYAIAACHEQQPPWREVEPDHFSRCLLVEQVDRHRGADTSSSGEASR